MDLCCLCIPLTLLAKTRTDRGWIREYIVKLAPFHRAPAWLMLGPNKERERFLNVQHLKREYGGWVPNAPLVQVGRNTLFSSREEACSSIFWPPYFHVSKSGWAPELSLWNTSTHPWKLEGRGRTLNPCMNANVEGPFETERIPPLLLTREIPSYLLKIGSLKYAWPSEFFGKARQINISGRTHWERSANRLLSYSFSLSLTLEMLPSYIKILGKPREKR